jgi:hypothetical protein
MSDNGRLSLLDAVEHATADDLLALDKAIADKTTEIAALESQRTTLRRLRSFVDKRLNGPSPGERGSVGRHGSGKSVTALIEGVIRERGPMTTGEIAEVLGRKEGGIRLAAAKSHYRFKVIEGNKLGLVG